jgi:ATP-dependent RNA helicase DeaD
VATDVAARGLDVEDLTHVINYGLPDDIENYTHRSGRTGRAGKKGTSISIIHTREKNKVRLIEKEIGKEFVDGTLPTPQEICTKQLYRAMDKIEKVDVDEEQIAPFMDDINRHFEYFEKEDIIKKIVSMTFGRFLSYYADAPDIEKPSGKGQERKDKGQEKGSRAQGAKRKPEKGYERLFINLGKADGFYPGELMQMLNREVGGRQQVGHIDLFAKFSYFEVPKQDAQRVMQTLTGCVYKGRDVRCNSADDDGKKGERRDDKGARPATRGARGDKSKYATDFTKPVKKTAKKSKNRDFTDDFASGKGDWRELMKSHKWDFKGDVPDFSEDGWALRKPRKKK